MSKLLKFLLIGVVVLTLLGIGVWIFLKWYIDNHKEELQAKIEEVANETLMGTVHFDSISFSPIKKFPHLSATIHNFSLVDSLYKNHNKKTVSIKEINASASVIDLWNETIKVNSVDIMQGEVNIFIDTDHYTNTYVFKPKKKSQKKKDNQGIELTDSYIDVDIDDIEFWFRERIKNKRITAHINALDFEINPKNQENMIPEIELDIMMKELGLNLANGSFFNNRRVITQIIPHINPSTHTMDSEWFDMLIGDQKFKNKAWVNFKEGKFKFHLTIPKANYKETVHLLSQNIQKKLLFFDIEKPIAAEATIEGKFEYKNNPVVWVKYDSDENKVSIPTEYITLNDTDIHGTFINRIYSDPEQQKTESVKNFRLQLDTFESNYKGIPYSLDNSQVYGTDKVPTVLDIHLKAKGENRNLSQVINSDNFQLLSGDFSVESDLKGPIQKLTDIFRISKTKVVLQNCKTRFKPENVDFQINTIDLYLDKEKTRINNFSVSLPNNKPLSMHGELNSFASYFDKSLSQKPYTKLYLSSNYLDAKSLVKTFSKPTIKTKKKDSPTDVNLRVMKNTLRGIMKTFYPEVHLNFKKFKLLGQEYDHVSGVLTYINDKLKIKNLSGTYKNVGKGNLNLVIGLNPVKNSIQEETLGVQYDLDIEGKIEYIVELLENDNFFFKDSKYHLQSSFEGYANSTEDLLETMDLQLKVGKGNMYYKNVGLNFRYDTLDISLKNDHLQLNNFKLLLPENESIELKGKIENFSNFIYKDNKKQLKSSIELYSSQLDLNNFIFLFNNNNKPNEDVNLKRTFRDLYQRYQPKVKVKIDKIEYNGSTVKNFESDIYYKNKDHLNFDNTAFSLFDDNISLALDFDIGKSKITPFEGHLTGRKSDIAKILQTFDNFNYSALENPAEITGKINLDADLKATIDDHQGVDDSTVELIADVEVNDLRIKNFEPIIKIGNIIFKKERFEDIKVLPVETQVHIKDNNVWLDKTTIQSSAFDAYILGVVDNKNETELWIAIPWENLKSRNYEVQPELKSEDQLGRQLYLQIEADGAGKLHYRLRFSKHKYDEAVRNFNQNKPKK